LAGLALAGLREVFLRRLRVILKDRKMDEADLARELKISPSAISHWYGKRQSEPDLATIGRIAIVLKTTPAELFVDSEVPPGRVDPPDPKDRLRYALEILKAELDG
jgi:transcriptional regulator with XRE-family HTH domain